MVSKIGEIIFSHLNYFVQFLRNDYEYIYNYLRLSLSIL